MSDNDAELIEAASQLLRKKYEDPRHTVASALRTKTGEIFTAVNSHHFNAFVCAEMSVLDIAINQGRGNVETLVAVHYRDSKGTIGVVNSCGKCRQIILDYAPETELLIEENGKLAKKSISELLPFAYYKQPEEIEE